MKRIETAVGIPPLIAGLLLSASPAFGATGCSFNSTTAVSFSTYDVFASSNDLSTGGAVTIVCTSSQSASISLSAGNSGSFTTRYMLGPGNAHLNYNLYTTSALATVWGDGTGGTSTVGGTVSSTPVTFTIYGSIPPNQYGAVAGVYSDSLTVSVTP